MLIEIDDNKMDWEQLRHQKLAMLELREKVDYHYECALTGLIHFLDYVQDRAVIQGRSKESVFGEYETDQESRLEVLER